MISGNEEARYGWLAIANSTTIDDGFGLDMGGGSIQTLRLEGRRLAGSVSLPLGSVRVSEEFLPGEKATPKGMRALRKRVGGRPPRARLVERRRAPRRDRGTIRNLAAAAMKRLDLPDIDVQGFALTREAVEELIEELAERPPRSAAG